MDSLSAQPAGRFLGLPRIVVRVTGRTCSATVAPSVAQKSTPLFITRTPRPRTPGGPPPRLTIFDLRSKSHARLRTIINSGVSGSCSSGSCGKRMAWVASAVRCSSSCHRHTCFDARVAGRFLELLRREYDGSVVLNPATKHGLRREPTRSWSGSTRVAADPAPTSGADTPGGWTGLIYHRLHGAPRKYWSKYDARYLDVRENALRSLPPTVDGWCVFDNTANGAALGERSRAESGSWDRLVLSRRVSRIAGARSAAETELRPCVRRWSAAR